MSEEKEEVSQVKDEIDLTYKDVKDKVKAGVNGFFIGLAVIVPGVSGSTFSIIFRLYDKIMYAISSIFKKFKPALLFLIPLIIGGLIGFVGGFFTVQQVIDRFAFICICLFGGLMLGGASEVADEIKVVKEGEKRKVGDIVLLIIGLILPVILSGTFVFLQEAFSLEEMFNASSFPVPLYFICIGLGFLVALTQVVPGLSATTLLMCFGAYFPLLDSASLTEWGNKPTWFVIYLMFVIGFLIGLFGFSKIVTYWFEKARFSAFHMLTGLAYGSVISIFYNTEIVKVYQSWGQGEGNLALDLGVGIPLFAIGLAASLALIYFAKKRKNNSSSQEA